MRAPEHAGSHSEPIDRRVARLAAAQHGVFSRRQLRDIGCTKNAERHRVDIGRWLRVAPGVFQLAGVPGVWRTRLMVACLSWGPPTLASHRAAIANWGLPVTTEGAIELVIPLNRKRNGGPGIVHRRDIEPVDATVVHAIPTTTVVRTIIDFAAVAEQASVEEALDAALHRRLMSLRNLRLRLDELTARGRPGVGLLGRLIDEREGKAISQSVFETRMRRFFRSAGLPEPVGQYAIGRRFADFAYPEVKLAVEADGRAFHSSRPAWEADRARDNELALLGWRVIHVTWTDLTRRPMALAARIRAALSA